MLKAYFNAIKNILFPRLCFYCGKKITHGYLCQVCEEKIEFLHPPLCRLCSMPINRNSTNICKNCIKKSADYDKLVSITAYKEPLISLVHLFKYKDCDYLAEYFAALMIKHLSKINFSLEEYSFITSIPVHSQTYKKRGYNQAELLGKKIADYFKIPFKNDIIYKDKFKPSQAKLPKEKRESNIKNTFTVKNNLLNQNIVIIDDIFTTGATIRECASTLKKKGADNILAITLAKTMSS